MTATLQEAVEAFVGTIRGNRRARTVRNVLIGDESQSGGAFALLRQPCLGNILSTPVADTGVQRLLPIAIRDSAASYTRDKKTVIETYTDFLEYLENKYGIHIVLEFPPLFNSPFDRQMHIVKLLHSNSYNASEFADRLWLSERTITNDLESLQDGITVLGQDLRIARDYLIRSSPDLNTIHPVFLTANLTQVVIMLRGLELMQRDPAYREYAFRLALNIWSELSDYGRQRIITVSDQLNLNKGWFMKLEDRYSQSLYATERECSDEDGMGNVLYFLKNRKSCSIEVKAEAGSVIYENCRINYVRDGEISITALGNEVRLPRESIIRCRAHARCMF